MTLNNNQLLMPAMGVLPVSSKVVKRELLTECQNFVVIIVERAVLIWERFSLDSAPTSPEPSCTPR
jgi:hypothetical protein